LRDMLTAKDMEFVPLGALIFDTIYSIL